MKPSDIHQLNLDFHNSSAQEVLQFSIDKFGKKLTLASSLGLEDQILTHMLSQLTDALDIFVLDTGRLHQETYDVIVKPVFSMHLTIAFFFQIKMMLNR